MGYLKSVFLLLESNQMIVEWKTFFMTIYWPVLRFLCVCKREERLTGVLIPKAPQTAVRVSLQGIRPDRRMMREH